MILVWLLSRSTRRQRRMRFRKEPPFHGVLRSLKAPLPEMLQARIGWESWRRKNWTHLGLVSSWFLSVLIVSLLFVLIWWVLFNAITNVFYFCSIFCTLIRVFRVFRACFQKVPCKLTSTAMRPINCTFWVPRPTSTHVQCCKHNRVANQNVNQRVNYETSLQMRTVPISCQSRETKNWFSRFVIHVAWSVKWLHGDGYCG